MAYTKEQAEHLNLECESTVGKLRQLQLELAVEGQPLDAGSRLREHLVHGAGRRVSVIRRSVQNVFTLFPPQTRHLLSADELADTQINLHAFLINMYGIFDNWAWAYILYHHLEKSIGDRRKVSFFHEATRSRLPKVLREYLSASVIRDWHEEYAKSYRDALAHRIPPYIPPAQFTQSDGERYNSLEKEKTRCILERNSERLDQIWKEQGEIGRPSMIFLHAYTENTPPQPMKLHPQILSDANTVVEFSSIFLSHWKKLD
jgi:hypothetical protein